jgi:hypothetical protein
MYKMKIHATIILPLGASIMISLLSDLLHGNKHIFSRWYLLDRSMPTLTAKPTKPPLRGEDKW